MAVVAGAGAPYAWTLHDYSPVCHRNHLVQPDGRYCGLAPVSECRSCLAVDADGSRSRIRASGGRRSGRSWRAPRGCSRRPPTRRPDPRGVPDLSVTVRPHVEPERSVRSTALQRLGSVRRVAVLGGISMPEGGLVLQALATDARKRDLPLRFAIVGYSDPVLTGALERAGVHRDGKLFIDDPTLDQPARAALQIAETGRHWDDDETLDLVDRISADLVLLTAISPETYSYALTPALRTGLPGGGL